MSKRQKRQTHRQQVRSAPPEFDAVMLHLVPVQPSKVDGIDIPEGVMIRVEAVDEDGETLEKATKYCSVSLSEVMLQIHENKRIALGDGVWRCNVHSDDEIDALFDSISEAMADASEDDVGFGQCEDCEVGEPCEIWGPSGSLTFVPRLPPPPEVDPEHVQAITGAMLEAHENGGLEMETLQAAMNRFCALKPKPVVKTALTMTPIEAAHVMELNWHELQREQLPRTAIEIAFRSAVAMAHPDHGGSDEKLHRVKEAKRALDAVFGDARAEE